MPAADEAGVAAVLVKLAQLAADLPEIREVDLNPLLADETGVIAVDARVAIAPVDRQRRTPSGQPSLRNPALTPRNGKGTPRLRDGAAIFLRPVRPEDESLYPPFLVACLAEDLRLRFFAPVKRIRSRVHRAFHPTGLRARHGVSRHRSKPPAK